MFGGMGGIGNIGNLLKGLDLNNLDFLSIANKLSNLVPDGKGKHALDLALGIAKNGGNASDVKRALEGTLSPEQKATLTKNQIWSNIPDDKEAIVNYGKNAAKQFKIMK